MKITKDNLNEVMFENHDARLLIEDVVIHTGANLYYYHDNEITVQKALDIWYKAQAAEDDTDMAFTITDYTRNQILLQSGQAMLAQANQTPNGVLSLLGA